MSQDEVNEIEDPELDALGRRRRERVFERRVTMRFSEEETQIIQEVQAELQARAEPGEKPVTVSAAVRWIISGHHQKKEQ